MNAKMKQAKQSKPKSVADYLAWQITLCGKSQLEIAAEAGFEKPNIITMIKQGKTKLPLGKVGKFAKAIGVDPLHLLKLCMSEYMEDTWKEVETIIGQPVLTKNEMEVIEIMRGCNVSNPKVRTDEERIKLTELFDELKSDNQTR